MMEEEHARSNENADLIRRAYEAYASGDLAAMLEFVDPDLEWTYLDPALEHPTPQVCHGRQELEQVLQHRAEHGLFLHIQGETNREVRRYLLRYVARQLNRLPTPNHALILTGAS